MKYAKDLTFKVKSGLTYVLNLRGRVTQICGESGTGKTYMIDILTALKNSKDRNNNNTDLDSYYIFDVFKDNTDTLKQLRGYIIFIDRADFLDEEVLNYINADRENIYVVIARSNLKLHISPNYFAELVYDKNTDTVRTTYRYDVRGWF